MLFVRTEGILLNCKRRGGHSLTGSSVSRRFSCIVRKLLLLQYSHKKKSEVFFSSIRISAEGITLVFKLKRNSKRHSRH